MARKTSIIQKASVARILMKAGAKRISQSAVDEFSAVIAEIALKIGEQASRIAKHSGRKTVQDEDIRIAARQ